MIIDALVLGIYNTCFRIKTAWKRRKPIGYMSYEWRSKLL